MTSPQVQSTVNKDTEAIAAYLKVIKSQGANELELQERGAFLNQLHVHLKTLPKTKQSYRAALKRFLDESDRYEWTFYLTISREYFLFWIDDVKTIAAVSQGNGFSLNIPKRVDQLIDIDRLREQILTTKFSTVEKWPLNNYAEAMRQDRELKETVEIKLMLAKMIVFKLRELDSSQMNAYRMTVNLIMPSFGSQEIRNLFGDVSVEFFPFYDGNPNAIELMGD